MSDDLTPRDVIAAHQRKSRGTCDCGHKHYPDGRFMDDIAAEHQLAELDAAGWSITPKPDPAVAFLRRCATCQVQNGIVPPHAECYRIADGGTDCCCGEVVPDVE